MREQELEQSTWRPTEKLAGCPIDPHPQRPRKHGQSRSPQLSVRLAASGIRNFRRMARHALLARCRSPLGVLLQCGQVLAQGVHVESRALQQGGHHRGPVRKRLPGEICRGLGHPQNLVHEGPSPPELPRVLDDCVAQDPQEHRLALAEENALYRGVRKGSL